MALLLYPPRRSHPQNILKLVRRHGTYLKGMDYPRSGRHPRPMLSGFTPIPFTLESADYLKYGRYGYPDWHPSSGWQGGEGVIKRKARQCLAFPSLKTLRYCSHPSTFSAP